MKCPFCGRDIKEPVTNMLYDCECGAEYIMCLPEDASHTLFGLRKFFGPDIDVKTKSKGGYIILFTRIKTLKNR